MYYLLIRAIKHQGVIFIILDLSEINRERQVESLFSVCQKGRVHRHSSLVHLLYLKESTICVDECVSIAYIQYAETTEGQH